MTTLTVGQVLPFLILGLLIGAAVRITLWMHKRAKRKAAEKDSAVVAYRFAEFLAARAGQPAEEWPVHLPPEVEHHKHAWNPEGNCYCGAYMEHGVVWNFQRGQVITVNGRWHRIMCMAVGGCWHWVLDGFPDEGTPLGEQRHFTSAELVSAMRGKEVSVRAE
jgi:hypothetical protein